MMKVIGFDIDGTLTFWEGGSKLVRFIPNFFLNLLVFSFPRKRIIKKLRNFKGKGSKIILISSRPKSLKMITIIWLNFWQVPYDELTFVGGKNRAVAKAKCIKEKRIEIFYDNSQKIIKYLQASFGIKAELV